MPGKYTIYTAPTTCRVRPVGKLGIVDWREDCSNCHNCVKRSCIYGLYRDEADTLHNELGYLDYIYQCKGCLNCIQNCTKNILTRVENPEFRRLGDEYFTPEIILSTWFQAETGRIPVSGSGYGGPFSGSGFDSMWTDMSEIVRPTRDGIHGREYISTSVEIGCKLKHLEFKDFQLESIPPPFVELPLPVIFDTIPEHWQRGSVVESVIRAASAIETMAVVRDCDGAAALAAEHKNIIPLVSDAKTAADDPLRTAPMVMVSDSDEIMAIQDALKRQNAERIVAIRMKAAPDSAERAIQLALDGAEVIYIVFDKHGRENAPAKPRHARDVLREIHRALVKEGIRDQVTLVASGGIALPEHMAKAIICGADLVAIDVPLLLALECRLCGECERGESCPIELEKADTDFAVRRIKNLLGAWHQQLVEVLGAMGIREVRRLRGETGRAMFFEDLERDSFGRLFGKRKNFEGANQQ
ncbi:MAG: glutamate synthase-related protein [Thermoguttaceae bacterium]